MAKNITLLYATTRMHIFDVAYGFAMPISPEWVIYGYRLRTLAHAFDVTGISVPISRGSPPLQTE